MMRPDVAGAGGGVDWAMENEMCDGAHQVGRRQLGADMAAVLSRWVAKVGGALPHKWTRARAFLISPFHARV